MVVERAGAACTNMIRTALKAGVGCLPRRAANGGATSTAGRQTFSSLQEALVKVTFVDVEVNAPHDFSAGQIAQCGVRAVKL